METECPDIFPDLRLIPDNFIVEDVKCCGGLIYYFGQYLLGTRWHPNGVMAFITYPVGGATQLWQSLFAGTAEDFCNFRKGRIYFKGVAEQCCDEGKIIR